MGHSILSHIIRLLILAVLTALCIIVSSPRKPISFSTHIVFKRQTSSVGSNVVIKSDPDSPSSSSSSSQISVDPDHPPSSQEIARNRTVIRRDWAICYDKGVQIWRELQEAFTQLPPSGPIDLGKVWTQSKSTISSPLISYHKFCEPGRLLSDLDSEHGVDHRSVQKICAPSDWEIVQYKTRQGIPDSRIRDFALWNMYSPRSRAIIVVKDWHILEPYESPYSDDKGDPIELQSAISAPHTWTQVAFRTWFDFCHRENVSVSVLQYVAHMGKVKDPTIEVAREAMSFDPLSVEARKETSLIRLWYTPFDPDFYAFLGSPNGIGIGKLLIEYASQFATRDVASGRVKTVKTIHSIEVDMSRRRPPSFAFVFTDLRHTFSPLSTPDRPFL